MFRNHRQRFAGWHPCLSGPPVPIPRELLRVISVKTGTTRSDSEATKILRALTFDYEWAGSGQLSLKCAFQGEAIYGLGRSHLRVDVTHGLLIERGQEYRVDVSAAKGVEMFSVFFAPGLIGESARTLRWSDERLLDNPSGEQIHDPGFFQHLIPMSPDLARSLGALSRLSGAREADPGALTEALHCLATLLLNEQWKLSRQERQLSTLRPGTRRELFRRLLVARDYAASSFHHPLSLEDLGKMACLSPSHLLRTFRAAFGVTPHRFLTECRLDAARDLLTQTELPVTEICLCVGFQSLGSFSSLFRGRFGAPPSSFRKKRFSRSAPILRSAEVTPNEDAIS